MRARLRSGWSMAREVVEELRADEPLHLAAALSYYTLLSLAPLLIVVVAIAGLAFGREAVEGRLVAEMQGLVGQSGAEVIQTILRNAEGPKRGFVSLAIGLVTLVIGATTALIELQSSLNRIWDVKAEAKKNRNFVWALVRDRILSLAMIFAFGFLLLVSLVISSALSAAGAWLEGRMTLQPAIWQLLNTAASFGIVAVFIAMIFKFLPDAKIRWRDVWFGTLVTAVFFTAGKYVIGLYLGRASIGSAYGAAGSVVALMVWIYYASLIFFVGAEITHVHTKRKRGAPPPVEYAVRAKPREAD